MMPTLMVATILMLCSCSATNENIDDDWCPSAAALTTFNVWMRENCGDENVAIEAHCYGAEFGVGARAVRELHVGDSYATLPPSLTIGVDTARARSPELAAMCDSLEGPTRFKWIDCILLFLVLERRDGRESFWAPYLDVLPRSFEHLPALFEDADIEELQASSARHYVERVRRVFDAKYGALSELQDLHPLVFQPAMTVEEYIWAAGVVGTRSIWFPDEDGAEPRPHLAPLVDSVNCRQLEQKDAKHRTMIEGGAVMTRAHQHFAVGEQVFDNYGHTNLHYFWMHGFSIEPNAFDCVLVPLNLEDLSAEGLCLSVEKLPASLAQYGGKGDAVAALIGVVEEHLARYATTLEADEKILISVITRSDRDVHEKRRRASVAFRLSEKRQLRAVLNELHAMAANSNKNLLDEL